jgi:hypothetical protein
MATNSGFGWWQSIHDTGKGKIECGGEYLMDTFGIDPRSGSQLENYAPEFRPDSSGLARAEIWVPIAQSRGTLLRASHYTAIVGDLEYSSIRPLIDWLDYNGYAVVTKATKECRYQ